MTGPPTLQLQHVFTSKGVLGWELQRNAPVQWGTVAVFKRQIIMSARLGSLPSTASATSRAFRPEIRKCAYTTASCKARATIVSLWPMVALVHTNKKA